MKRLYIRNYMAVPRIGTDALAEKAKICRFNLVKGIRQVSPVTSVEGMSNFVFDLKCIIRSQ